MRVTEFRLTFCGYTKPAKGGLSGREQTAYPLLGSETNSKSFNVFFELSQYQIVA